MKSGVAIMLKIMSVFALLGALLLASRVDAQDLPNFPDNLGKEFVVVFMENAFFSKTTESLELVLFITNPNDSPVTVNIETPKITSGGKGYFKKSDTIKAGGVLLVELPKDLRIVGSSTKSNKAVVVKATKEIGIYGSNQESYSTGAFVGFPVDVLGKNYYAVTWERAHYKSQIALVATEGGTSVDIVVGPNGKADFGGKTYDAGDKLTVTLAKYESIQIQSTDKEDLTGTSISANKAIAAFSGNQKVNIMNVKGPYDHLVEQLMPVKTWGTTFITLPIPGKSTGDAFRFVASEDSTIITITGMKDEPETIKIDKAGGSKTKLISSEKRTLIKSTKPILVAQFSLSRNAKIFGTDKISSDDGDASMIIIPPVQQLNSDYIFSTLSTKRKGVQTEFTNKFMLAILDEDKNGLLLDGKSLNLLKPTWKKITGTKYMGADFDISPGVHRISHQNPSKTYAGYLYGFTKNEAYSFSTGMRLAQINPCMAKAQVGTNGDGIDNDCDGRIDEEICFEGAESDQDADGKINEDCATVKSDYLRAVSFFKEETVVTSYNAKIFFTPSKKGPLPNYFNVYGYQTSKGASKRQFLKRLVLASANTKVTFTLNGLKGETEYTFTVSSRLTGSEVRADNSITVKTTKDPLVAKAATDKTKIEFKLTLENAKLAYTVEWYNEISKTVKKIKTVQLDIGTTTAVLAQSELTLSGYGMIVYAKIYSCKAKPCSTTTVTPFLSNKWRAEVKTTTTKLMLIEGGKEEEIKFTSSAPPSLLCIKDDGPCDSVRVEAYQLGFTSDFKTWNQKPIHQAVISQAGKKKSESFCGVEITDASWYEEMTISVKGKVDRLYDGKQTRLFQLDYKQRVKMTGSIKIKSVKITGIEVTVADADKRGLCLAHFHPHIKTFDNSYFNNNYEGEFVLYKHKSLPYAAHIVQKRCMGKQNAACICAVAVKSGDDVIMIDSCDKQKGRMSLSLQQNGELTPGTKVYNYGFLYKILLPTGGIFTVYPSFEGRYMSVIFRPSTVDYNKGQGLCGQFDGDMKNDLQLKDGKIAADIKGYKAFSLMWRVDKKTSLISGVCPLPKEEPGTVFCDCTGNPTKDRCDYGLDARPFEEFLPRSASDKYSADKTEDLVRNAQKPRPAIKCGTDDQEDEAAYIIKYDYTLITKITITSSWTEIKAKEYCVNYLKKSPAVPYFETKLGKDKMPVFYDIGLKVCVMDIMDYGDTNWAVYIRESLNILFKFELISNIKYWVKVKEEWTYPTIVGSICYKDCSGKGTCSQGVCSCKPGYAGIDCSIDNTKPPAIDFVAPLACDTNKPDSGARISLFGNNFVQSASLTCQTQSVTVDIKKTETIGPVTKTTAIHISRYQVICVAKVCTQFQVAVGNNERAITAKFQAVKDIKAIKKATLTSSLTVEKKMEWKCSFDVNGKAETLYTVEWYSAEKKFFSSTVDGNNEGKAILTEEKFTMWKERAGLQCRVVACQKASCDKTKSVVVMSNVYIKEIKFEGCLIDGKKYDKDAVNPTDKDEVCDPEKDKNAWTKKEFEGCLIDGKKYDKGTVNPNDKDEICDPDKDKKAWTKNEFKGCMIGEKKYNTGAINPEDEEEYCDPEKDKMDWTKKVVVCMISGKKYEYGDANPSNDGEICNPYIIKTTWTKKKTCVSFDFSKIESDKLDIDGMKIKVSGGAKVVMEDKKYGLRLNGKKQSLGYRIAKGSCLADLSMCKAKGLSFVLPIKFKSLKENMYFLSSGGETTESQGLSVVRKFGKLWFILNTDSKAWYVPIESSLSMDKWYNFEVSFSESSGVEIYDSGKLIKKVSTYVSRKATKKMSSMLFIGKASSSTCTQEYADIEIGTTHVCHATRQELVNIGIIMGPPTLPPTPPPTTLPPVPKTCKGRPILAIPPTLNVDFSETSAQDVTITCSIDSISSSVEYGIQYFVGGKPVQFGWMAANSKAITLEKSKFTLAKLKGGLFCTLTARYRTVECVNTKARARKSTVYKADIEIKTKDKITITEGGKEEVIDIFPTAPPDVLCGMGGASLEISVVLQRSRKDLKCKKRLLAQAVIRPFRALKGQNACGTVINSETWRMSQKIGIKGFLDFKKDRTQARFAWVYLKCKVGAKIKTTRKIRTIEITTIDNHRQAVCKSIGDPHFTTFDGVKYNNYKTGEFIMYKHEDKPYVVHTFLERCGKASCNCGVAVRCDDDVAVIDRCRRVRGKKRLRVEMFKKGDLTPGFEVISNKKQYEIHLPSGTYVKVNIRKTPRKTKVVDVFIYASPTDYGKTSGLCGPFDGSKRNDLTLANGKIGRRGRFPNKFSLSWRIPKRQTRLSLFNGISASTSVSTQKEYSYCQCIGTGPLAETRCGLRYDMNDCDRTFGIMRGKRITKQIIRSNRRSTRKDASGRRKRATDEPAAFDYDPAYTAPDTKWPTPKGKTEEQARQICQNAIANSTAVQTCSKAAPTDFSTQMENCIEDIGASDEEDWAQSGVGSITEDCSNKALTDTSLYKAGPDGTLQPPQALIDAACPNNCANQGTCVNGTCNCNTGFIGDDCSLPDGPPEVTEFQDDGVCDINEDSCTSVIVLGDNFYSNDQLTCHMEETEIGAVKRTGGVKTAKAIYISDEQVVCTLPKVAPYYISVSNDGQRKSPEFRHLVVDSTCHSCSSPDKCDLTKTGCLIGGRCLKDGTVDPGYKCNICNAKVKNNGWSRRKDEGCAIDKGVSLQTIIIIAASFFVGLVLAVAIIVCCARKYIVKKPGTANGVNRVTLSDSNTMLSAKAWKADYKEGINSPSGFNNTGGLI